MLEKLGTSLRSFWAPAQAVIHMSLPAELQPGAPPSRRPKKIGETRLSQPPRDLQYSRAMPRSCRPNLRLLPTSLLLAFAAIILTLVHNPVAMAATDKNAEK